MKGMRGLQVGSVVSLVLLLAGAFEPARADSLTPGDILISDETFGSTGRIREFTSSGQLVQTFTFPSPAPGGDAQARGITVDSNGNIQIYNGTFNPALTTLNPATGAVLGNTFVSGWSTVNNVTYGGLAAFGNYVFATDMATAGAGAPNGIIRFNVNNPNDVIRFASGAANGSGDYIQIATGLNGLLYAEFPGTSPGGNHLDVFDPTTLALQREIDLGHDLRSIAVDQNGDIFATNTNDSHIYEFDPNGVLLRAVDTGVRGLSEIVIDESGRLLAASGGTLVLTDTSLSSFTTLDVGTISLVDTFVAFVEPPLASVPEPGSLILLGMGAVCLAGYTWRRKKPSA